MVVGIVTVIALVLMISGLVLKNAILTLASTMCWVIFAFLMYGYTFDNAAMNNALLMFGGIMAIISAVLSLNIWASKRPRKMSEDAEQEEFKKKVLKMSRRR